MTQDTSTTADRSGARPALPSQLDDFLVSYEAGPGATTTEQELALTDLTDSVRRMQVHEAPFTVGTIEDFLPRPLYHAVLRDWPAESTLDTVSLSARCGTASDYFGTRKTKLLEDWAAGGGALHGTGTWNQVRLALRAPTFVRSLFTRFSNVVEANLAAIDIGPDDVPSFKLYANFDQGAKEALGAHVDALRKLLTIVVYLDLSGKVTDDSPKLWGTALYDAEPGIVKPLNFSSNANRRVAHQVEFAANRAFVMPNTSRALHGVAGGQWGVTRRTLMCGYWLMAP